MAGSHTPTSMRHTSPDTSVDSSRLTLASTVEHGLPARLAGRVDGHLATFAAHMREGLLAASTAVGLEVMAELMDAEATELVSPKGRHDPRPQHEPHRMFSHISMNWRGRPLETHEAVVQLIGATTTREGLRIHAELDDGAYPHGNVIPEGTGSVKRWFGFFVGCRNATDRRRGQGWSARSRLVAARTYDLDDVGRGRRDDDGNEEELGSVSLWSSGPVGFSSRSGDAPGWSGGPGLGCQSSLRHARSVVVAWS